MPCVALVDVLRKNPARLLEAERYSLVAGRTSTDRGHVSPDGAGRAASLSSQLACCRTQLHIHSRRQLLASPSDTYSVEVNNTQPTHTLQAGLPSELRELRRPGGPRKGQQRPWTPGVPAGGTTAWLRRAVNMEPSRGSEEGEYACSRLGHASSSSSSTDSVSK